MTAVKKIVLWCMSTLTVLVLLFGYHTSTSSQAATAESSTVTPVAGSLSAAATPSATAAAVPSAAAAPSAAATTVTGAAVSTRYGPVQVQVTVADGTITDISVVDYPASNGKDQQINGRALPVLVQETLDAQSASIDMVSGATYTSNGYLQSLQSALDQAGM